MSKYVNRDHVVAALCGWLLPLGLMLALTACSIAPSHRKAFSFPLLAPSALGATRSAQQVLHAAFNADQMVFQSVVDAGPDQLTLIGLSAQGQRLFRLRYDGVTLQSEVNPLLPDRIDPRRVLADLQLAFWPLPALQQAAAGTAWQISEPDAMTRRVRRDGRIVAEVHYAGADPWQGRLWLSNFEFDYSLEIASQPMQ